MAFMLQGGHQHAGAEQRDPFTPQPRPGGDSAVFDGDDVAVGGHDPCGEVGGAGLFGLAGAARDGGVITTGAPIPLRERVVAVGQEMSKVRPLPGTRR